MVDFPRISHCPAKLALNVRKSVDRPTPLEVESVFYKIDVSHRYLKIHSENRCTYGDKHARFDNTLLH